MAVRRHLASVRADVVHTHLISSDVLGGIAMPVRSVLSTQHSIVPRVSLRVPSGEHEKRASVVRKSQVHQLGGRGLRGLAPQLPDALR